jgi:hypothetical protein
VESDNVLFISIKFKGDELSNRTGFKQYNYASPWVIRIQIDENKDGPKIQRHKEFGEVPEFWWYKRNFPDEFPYDGRLPGQPRERK